MITFSATDDALLDAVRKTGTFIAGSELEYVEVHQFEPGCSQGMRTQLGVYKGPSLKLWPYFPESVGGCVSRVMQKQCIHLILIQAQLFDINTWSPSGKRTVCLHGDLSCKPAPTKEARVLALLDEIKKVVEAP